MAASPLEAAYDHCRAVARGHYENFPVASLAVPARIRPHVCAVYAFARSADDFADEAEHEGRRLERLDAWEAELDRALAGTTSDPVFLALGDTIRRFDLPDRLLRDLLDAFRQDCRVRRYARFEDLLDYSRRSANPVGRLVLLLFGERDEAKALRSDAICTALQLTNFWQDVAVDLEKDRIYLPEEDRLRHGVTEAALREGRVDDAFRALMAEMTARTRDLYAEGAPLLDAVRGRLRLELRLVVAGGTRILHRLESGGYDVFRRRPRLALADWAAIGARALFP
ncbi:MAG TPA: squalene synthase HpnC [Candidatus Polarisedimenticolaceae bacterium]